MTQAVFRILIADKISADGLVPLREDGRFEIVNRPGLSGDDLARAMADADAVIVRSATKITRASLGAPGRLKVIGRAGVGVDTIDVDAATEHGIAVLNAPSGNTISAAELAFALLLALVRRVPAADRSMKQGEWDRARFSGTELQGKTLGLVGAGRIGGEVSRRAHAFGMRVVVYDPFLNEDRARTLDVELASLEDVLRRADVLSIHVPLTDSTAGLIGAAQLAMMKRGALLVNAARGGIVDESALAHALANNRLGGAALDVFEQEPLPADHPLRKIDNLVLTPHLGASTEEAQQNVALEIAEAVRAALLDGDLSRAVNAPAIGGDAMRRLRPLLDLGERLGRLAATLAPGAVSHADVRYAGSSDDALRPLVASTLVGLLVPVVGERAVNFVNALHLAKTRGIEVQSTRLSPHGNYTDYIEVRLASREGDTRVAGTLLGEGHPRVVRIGDHQMNVTPDGALVMIRNRDVPGVIGRVGTLLGDAGINIAEYHQARLEAGGDAFAVIRVDSRLPTATITALRKVPDVIDVRQVQLG